MSAKWQQLQRFLGITADGIPGDQTADAVAAKLGLRWDHPAISSGSKVGQVHQVMASSFADPADVLAFRKCKAQGKSDQECFKVGDNGIGKWGDDTTADRPMCALPPDDWKALPNPRGAKVIVRANGRTVECELRDTMPAKKNIKNGCGIDLNPAAVKALGLKPPIKISATWQWG